MSVCKSCQKNSLLKSIQAYKDRCNMCDDYMHPYTSSFDLISGLNHAWPAAPHLHSQGREVYVRPEALSVLV